MTHIPDGWTLVPNKPTERMLSEFAGYYWPHLPREKKAHEEEAYAAMLAVAPSPPVGGMEEIQALRLRYDDLLRAHRRSLKRIKDLQLRLHRLESTK